MASGILCCSLAGVSAGMTMLVGLDPSRAVYSSASNRIFMYCRSYHVYSTSTVGGNVPFVTSLAKAAFFHPNLTGLKSNAPGA